MLFARRRSRTQQAIGEIGDASSGFLQFVAMGSAVINGTRLSTGIATRCSLVRPRTQIRYMAGSTYRPLAICEASINRRGTSGHHPVT
jgi:hypothetical protein